MPIAAGKFLGRYEIISPLGTGGMGDVYLAQDKQLNRRVAVKFPNLAADKHQAHARFLREARVLSTLSHPHIATIYDYGKSEDDQPYIVMEFVKGEALSHLVHTSVLTVARAVKIIADVADALAEAHRHGIIHRDIKPSNVMINDRSEVKVLDFGLAKQLTEVQAGSVDTEIDTLLETNTQSGIVLGTLLYLSPEQAIGEQVDARSDIFALGVLLYECITGQPAFSGKRRIEIVAEVIHFNPPIPSTINPQIPQELDRITMKALAKEPGERYQSASALRADLLAIHHTLENSANVRRHRVRPAWTTHRASAVTTLSDALQRPRLSPLMVLVGIVLLGLIVWGIKELRRPPIHVPSVEALRLYDRGTDALRMGSFFQASNALKRATETDDQFALAHARLAEAWMELDHSSRAMSELLRVAELTSDQARLTEMDVLYLDAVKATVRRNFAGAIDAYLEIARRKPDQPQVYVDLGRAFEKNNQSDRALESYLTATRDGQNAIAFLRLGVLYARQHNLAEADSAFDKAETINQDLANVEGRAEVAFQRGVMLNDIVGKVSDARAELERAREIATVVNSQFQLIKINFQLSSVSIKDGKTDQAQEYAREAIALAQNNQMENLIARGYIDLGNVYFARGDYSGAEKYFQQGLEAAQRYDGQQNMARARLSLASSYIQRGESDRGLGYAEEAITFYQNAGYRTETSQALLLRGRAFRQKGDYSAALKAFAMVEETGDQTQIAYAHGSIGSLLLDQERYQEALRHFQEVRRLYQTLGYRLYEGYALMHMGEALWRLGQHEAARQALGDSSRIAQEKGASFSALQAAVDLIEAEMSLSDRRFPEAFAKSRQALALAGAEDKVVTVQGKSLSGLAQALLGRASAGQQLCEDASSEAARLGDPLLLARSQLAFAQAALLSGDLKRALERARLAQTFFGGAGLQESEWRAELIAGLASQKAGDNDKAKLSFASATDRLLSLEKKWGEEVFRSYLARPDIQLYRRQLDQSSSVRR